METSILEPTTFDRYMAFIKKTGEKDLLLIKMIGEVKKKMIEDDCFKYLSSLNDIMMAI